MTDEDDYSCLECWHSPDTMLPSQWDRQTWQEGYTRGYSEGYEAGRHDGRRALTRDLLQHFHTWRIDTIQLQLHGAVTPYTVWQGLLALVEQEGVSGP